MTNFKSLMLMALFCPLCGWAQQVPCRRPEGRWAKKVSEGGLFGKEFGGPDDVAFPNANENYELVKVPVAVCNLPVGHGATYAEHHGGAFAVIALKWKEKRLGVFPTFFCLSRIGRIGH